MAAVTVRERTNDDVDECVQVLHRVFAKDAYPQTSEDFHSFLTGRLLRSWVATLDGRIVGHVSVGGTEPPDLAVRTWREKRPDNDTHIAVLKRLFVDPEARGKGIAPALIQAVSSWAESVSTRLVLFVKETDGDAERLYRKLMWEEYGTGVFEIPGNKYMNAICFVNPAAST